MHAGPGFSLSPKDHIRSGTITYVQFQPLGTLLKATLLVNWSRGPFGSGTHHAKLVEAAQDLMSRKGADNEFMSMMAELTASDREIEIPEDFQLTPQLWIEACEGRIPKARGKAWFGICESFSQLNDHWAILLETVSYVQHLSKKLKVPRYAMAII